MKGARVAAVNQIANSPDCVNDRPIVAQTRDAHWSIKRCAADKALTFGVTESDVTVASNAPARGHLHLLADPSRRLPCHRDGPYTYRATTPIIGDILGPIALEAVSEMPIERVFP